MEQNVSSEELWQRRLSFLFREPSTFAGQRGVRDLDTPSNLRDKPVRMAGAITHEAGEKYAASVGMNDVIAEWKQGDAHRNSLRKSQSMGKLRRKPAPLVTDLSEETDVVPSQLDNALAGINEMMRSLGFDMAEIPKPVEDPYASIGSMLTPGPKDTEKSQVDPPSNATHSRTRSDTTASLNTRRTRRTIVCHGHSKSLDEFQYAASGLDVVDDDEDSTRRLAIAAGILPRLLEPPPKTPVVVVAAPQLPSPTETPIISDWAEYLYSSSSGGEASPPSILKELAPPSRPERAASIRKRGEALFTGHVEIEERTTLGHVIPAGPVHSSPLVSAFFTDQIWEPLPSPTAQDKMHPGRVPTSDRVMETCFRGRAIAKSVSEASDKDGVSIGSFDWEQSSNSSMSSMTSDEGSDDSDDSGHSWLQSLKFSKKGRPTHSRQGSNASAKDAGVLDKQQAALDALLANFALPEDRTVKTKPAPIQIKSTKSMGNLRRVKKETSQTAYAHRKAPADVPGTPATARQEWYS
jgi:hypothetical protein